MLSWFIDLRISPLHPNVWDTGDWSFRSMMA